MTPIPIFASGLSPCVGAAVGARGVDVDVCAVEDEKNVEVDWKRFSVALFVAV